MKGVSKVRRGQVWSMDLIVAVVIFLLAIGIFYFFANSRATDDAGRLQLESQLVAQKLTSQEALSIAPEGSVDEVKLNNLTTKAYKDLQEELGVRDDFCIIIKDADGNLVLLGDDEKTSVGNPDLQLLVNGSTYNCGDAYVG